MYTPVPEEAKVSEHGAPHSEQLTAPQDVAGPVTRALHAAAEGNPDAANELLPLVYDQLLAIARHRMQRESPDHTLQPTALVNEAYLRLVGSTPLSWSSRAHFFRAAAQAMRRILIDHARRRGRDKRGGQMHRKPLDAIDMALSGDHDQIIALDAALERLAKEDPRAAGIVELRFYAGLSVEDTGAALGLSERTVKREWAFARAWLYRALEAG